MRFLFVAGGDTTTVSDASEETLNDVAMLVSPTIVGFFAFAGRVGSDAGLAVLVDDLLSNRIAVVSRIRNDMLHIQGFEQHRSLRRITPLPSGQHQATQLAFPIDRGMQLRGQPTSGSPEASPRVGLLFFHQANVGPSRPSDEP